MDFRCPAGCGYFEASEPLSAPVSTHARCPKCGTISPKVWLKPPMLGKIDKGVFVIDLPTGKPGSGQFTTMLRDEAEARLAYEPPVPFADEKARREVLSDRLDRLMAAQDRGEPIGKPPVDPDTIPESVKRVLNGR